MPKIVDPDERRAVIVEAVFALVERGGIEAASLRAVAAETGLNIGSVRHYFDGHEAILSAAAEEMGARVRARVEAKARGFDGLTDPRARAELAVDLMEELLPLDAARRREVVVWLAFCERSRFTPRLQERARALLDGSRELAGAFVAAAEPPCPDLAVETLAATIDGLGIALLHEPDRLGRGQVRDLLRAQLAAVLGGRRTVAEGVDQRVSRAVDR